MEQLRRWYRVNISGEGSSQDFQTNLTTDTQPADDNLTFEIQNIPSEASTIGEVIGGVTQDVAIGGATEVLKHIITKSEEVELKK